MSTHTFTPERWYYPLDRVNGSLPTDAEILYLCIFTNTVGFWNNDGKFEQIKGTVTIHHGRYEVADGVYTGTYLPDRDPEKTIVISGKSKQSQS